MIDRGPPERSGGPFASDQALRAQADMAVQPDDQVIVDRDVQSFARVGDRSGDLDIRAAGGRIARRMVMDQPRRMR